jgi:hypothetical protein
MRMIVEAFKDALELGLQKENQVVVSVASAVADVVVLASEHERSQSPMTCLADHSAC